MARKNVNSGPRTAAPPGVGEAGQARPCLPSLQTEKSQVAHIQTCQEQPFSLPGGRKLWPRALGSRTWVRGRKCPPHPEIVGGRPPCEAPAPLRAARCALRGEAAPAPPANARSADSRPGHAGDAERESEGTTAAVFQPPLGWRPHGESLESLTAGGSVPGRRRQIGRTNFWSRSRRPPSSLLLSLRPASASGRPSLRPARAYLQAIGRPGAETAPAARGFRLPPHPRAAAPLAAVRAAALLGGSLAPGPAAPFRAPAGSRLAGAGPRGAGDRPRRGGAGRGRARGGRAAQGPGAEAARCAREAAGSGTEAGRLRGAGAAERGRREGAGPPWPTGRPGAPPRGQAPPRHSARGCAGSLRPSLP